MVDINLPVPGVTGDFGTVPSGQDWAAMTVAAIRSINNAKMENGALVTNPKDYGAVGDDVTDDTASLQAAINAAGIGGRVHLPKGRYKTGPLTLLDFQTLEGTTQYLGSGSAPTSELVFTGLTGTQTGITPGANNTFENLLIWGPGYNVGTVSGVKTGSGSPRFRNCGFYAWVFGVNLTGAYYAAFDNCEWSYNAYGVSLSGCFNVSCIAPRFNCADQSLVHFGSAFSGAARALNVFGGSIENYGVGGAIRPASAQAVNLFGVYFESSNTSNGGAWGVTGGSKSQLSITMQACFVYLTEHNRFVDLSGATTSTLRSVGNHFVCPSTSTSAPIAYVLGASPTSDVVIDGDSWTEVAKGTYTDNETAFTAGGVSGVMVRHPVGYSTYGGSSFHGRSVIVDAAHVIRSGVGVSGSRPSGILPGSQWFDTTLNKPIWWNGTAWTDATGATV